MFEARMTGWRPILKTSFIVFRYHPLINVKSRLVTCQHFQRCCYTGYIWSCEEPEWEQLHSIPNAWTISLQSGL